MLWRLAVSSVILAGALGTGWTADKQVQKKAPLKASVESKAAPSAKAAPAAKDPAKTASKAASEAKADPAAKPAIPTVALPMDTASEASNADLGTLREKVYYYQAFNQRDPFQSLVSGEFETSGESDIVDIYGVRLVGILSGGNERFAMLEDNAGYAYIMKAGDPIRNGNIVSVGERSLIARVTLFGQTNTLTLRLEEKKKGE